MKRPYVVEYRQKQPGAMWFFRCACETRKNAERKAREWEQDCYHNVETRIIERGKP